MFVKFFAPVAANCRRSIRPCADVARSMHYRPARHLPVWMRPNRSLVEDFCFPRKAMGPFAAMENVIKNMERNMDKMTEDMWRSTAVPWAVRREGGKELDITYNSKKFEIKLDVSQYTPEEVNVKLLGDKLEISAKHSEKPDDHGYVSREFTRQFLIPEDVDPETMESMLTDEGILVVMAKVKGEENVNERIIKIQRDSKPAGQEEENTEKK